MSRRVINRPGNQPHRGGQPIGGDKKQPPLFVVGATAPISAADVAGKEQGAWETGRREDAVIAEFAELGFAPAGARVNFWSVKTPSFAGKGWVGEAFSPSRFELATGTLFDG